MSLTKVIPLIGVISLACSAIEPTQEIKNTPKEEAVPITVYSLFVKNPSYERLAQNLQAIKEEIPQNNLDINKTFAFLSKESFTPLKKSAKKSDTTIAKTTGSYDAFIKSAAYPKTFAVYKDEKLLNLAKKMGSKIIIDRKTQRIKLVVNGKVAIDSPCTTGSARKIEPHTKKVYNKVTPKGVFRIQEKIVHKRSTIFGRLYRYGKLVFKGDRRKYKGPPAKYEGAELKNWMRLTSSGIGIHGSKYIKRYPASNGCIRVPYKVVGKIFSAVKTGTKVIVR